MEFTSNEEMEPAIAEGVRVVAGILRNLKESSPHLRALTEIHPRIAILVLAHAWSRFVSSEYPEIVGSMITLVGEHGTAGSAYHRTKPDIFPAVRDIMHNFPTVVMTEAKGLEVEEDLSEASKTALRDAALQIIQTAHQIRAQNNFPKRTLQ